MPDYRSFPLDSNGRVAAPGVDFEADDDDAAIAHAASELNGKDISLWNGARLVATLQANERKRA